MNKALKKSLSMAFVVLKQLAGFCFLILSLLAFALVVILQLGYTEQCTPKGKMTSVWEITPTTTLICTCPTSEVQGCGFWYFDKRGKMK